MCVSGGQQLHVERDMGKGCRFRDCAGDVIGIVCSAVPVIGVLVREQTEVNAEVFRYRY